MSRESPPDESLLTLDTRKRIFEYVRDNPGVHFSALSDALGMEIGLLQYHVSKLESYGVVESESHRGRRRFFVRDALDDRERTILSLLRYETTRRLLLTLLEDGPVRNGHLADDLDVAPSTVSWHLSSLVEEGVVVREEGDTTRYRLADAATTAHLLVRYRESFVDRAVDRIVDFWG